MPVEIALAGGSRELEVLAEGMLLQRTGFPPRGCDNQYKSQTIALTLALSIHRPKYITLA